MKKSNYFITGLIALIIIGVVAAGTVMFLNTRDSEREKTNMTGLMTKLSDEIQNFHREVGSASPSVIGKVALQNELTKLISKADTTLDALRSIKSEADKSESLISIPVRKTVDRSIKYVAYFQKRFGQKINDDTLRAASSDFFSSFNQAEEKLSIVGSPTESDSKGAISSINKLITNLNKANKPVKKVVANQGRSGYPGWVNTASDRRVYSEIERIAQEIQQSRRNLGSHSGIDWSQGKYGNNSYFNQTSIRNTLYSVISEKRSQLQRVERIAEYEGSSELTSIVEQMLRNSIYGLTSLADDADYGRFKAFNSKNDDLASILANQYGIKAMGR